MDKFPFFLDITRKLNRSFRAVPVLYGSLGLSRVLDQPMRINDIDILIPDEYVTNKWANLVDFMAEFGFKLKDEHEHEFEKDTEIVAFAKYKALEDIGLTVADLKKTEIDGAIFYELSAKQFLAAYTYCLADGYRQAKRSDTGKIEMIKRSLS